jgi:hypothetical protein
MSEGQQTARKRPALSFGDPRPAEQAPASEPTAPAPAASEPVEAAPARRTTVAPSRQGKKGVTFYLTTPGWKELRNLAMDEERSTADLMVEATNLLFEKYGRPRIAQG